ncbi:MAG: pteridine reductase, partial [Gammaproteobacteria bacterium]|nr:pteridine reductase [Gammaproteobacteria bacterium]
RKFHLNGFNVIIHCNQSVEDAWLLANELNEIRDDSATVLTADLTREEQVLDMAKKVPECFGPLAVLVNNASGFYPTPFGEVTSRQWHDLMDSNLKAAFFLVQALAGQIRQQQGAVVNLIDIYAAAPLKNYAVYSIAKAGLKAMTRALALELAPQVRVNGVSPGAIIWPSGQEGIPLANSKESIIETIPLGRFGAAEEIAEAVLFLAVGASYVTGETIRVDGGRALNL